MVESVFIHAIKKTYNEKSISFKKILPFHKLDAMKNRLLYFTFFLLTGFVNNFCFANDDHPTLAIGSKAPPFSLKGVDGKTYTLASFNKYRILVIIFTCNHCPTAQAYENRIIQLANDYQPKN